MQHTWLIGDCECECVMCGTVIECNVKTDIKFRRTDEMIQDSQHTISRSVRFNIFLWSVVKTLIVNSRPDRFDKYAVPTLMSSVQYANVMCLCNELIHCKD